MLVLSLVGIIIWISKNTLTEEIVSQLQAVDADMIEAESAFVTARFELERTMRLVETTEASMQTLNNDFTMVRTLAGRHQRCFGRSTAAGLLTSQEKIDQAKSTLQSLRDTLAEINSAFYGNQPAGR